MSARVRCFRRLLLVSGILTALAAPVVRAEDVGTKKGCLAAFDRAQQLRATGKLRDARDALIECSREACPALVRKDCDGWMGEVLASLPSVVFGAQDAAEDLVAVRVSVDGVVVQEKLEGKAIPIDPGPHVIRYELADGTVSQDQVVVREGEKNRTLTAKLAPPAAALSGAPRSVAPMAPPPPGLSASASPKSSPGNLVAGIASGAAGLGALGAALAFDIAATNEAHALPCAAARSCTDADVEPAREKYLYADVLLGVGSAALVAGVVVLLVRPFHAKEPATSPSPFRLDASVSRNGGGVRLGCTF